MRILPESWPVRSALVVFCLSAAAFAWWLAAEPSAPDKIFGIYSLRVFAFLMTASYVFFWISYFVLSREGTRNKVKQCVVATSTFLVLFGLLEAPAALGLVDYRFVIHPPQGLIYKRQHLHPMHNPRNRLDRELLWIRRPKQTIVGETFGGFVYLYGVSPNQTYAIDVQYDSQGFRNDHEIDQAPVIVIGDSFVEGPLNSKEEILSSRLSKQLRVEVANLGQSGYGPQQEFVVLRRYGLPLRPRIVLWFFFEGNDLVDVHDYDRIVQEWNTMVNDPFSFKDRSLAKNALLFLAGVTAPKARTDSVRARRNSCQIPLNQRGRDKTMYFFYPGSSLSSQELAGLETAQEILRESAKLSADHGAKFLLVFVPMKFRVYSELCRFPEDGNLRTWQGNDLPSRLEAWSETYGIDFLDLTPALKRAAASGELVFFTDDLHWDAKGNGVAARTIIGFLERNGWLEEAGLEPPS